MEAEKKRLKDFIHTVLQMEYGEKKDKLVDQYLRELDAFHAKYPREKAQYEDRRGRTLR